ncbi:beta-galactosidase [Aestuariibacter sp. A3R04]|uniref:beta-galactosidase n=1 Tax=Aestuariibacter sp. A3R04 TaxID=2841571 RepID=UPI001C081B73|nr:beta-galactosidase [Aestuariibacter sp. A3R04]MBU3021251.1 beta-galactosidase [Aestuariibacter sp. A3R04]
MHNSRIVAVFASLFCALTGVQGCSPDQPVGRDAQGQNSSQSDSYGAQIMPLFASVDASLRDGVTSDGVRWSVLNNDDGANIIDLQFLADEANKPRFTLTTETPWNFEQYNTVAIVMDIENPSAEPVHLHVGVGDVGGKKHNRNTAVPPHSKKTYYALIKGENVSINTGMRSNPKQWETDYTQLIWRNGNRIIDTNRVNSMTFQVMGIMTDKHIRVSNMRAVEPRTLNDKWLTHIVDEYGQNNNQAFVGKIESDAQLQEYYQQELASMSGQVPADRSQFGGWKAGPKLDATGYFRVAKHEGKWTLIDPEGYLFFSAGIANVRMANTSTITGFDVPENTVVSRSEADLTPEDSMGLNRVSDEAAAQRFIASPLRAGMFTSLPEYASDLGNFYGYRRSVHTGTLAKGETYSFYLANLSRKFNTPDMEEIMDKWEALTVDRMLDWGFTSFGNWIDPRFYDNNNFPYFANGWIIGDFKTVSSGNDYWAPIPDPFDKTFAERTDITVQQIANEVKNSPWCVGVFIDNEKSWGIMGSPQGQYGLVAGTMKLSEAQSPAKRAFVAWIKEHYSTIDEFNAAWKQSFHSFDDLSGSVDISYDSELALADYSALLTYYADTYFRIVSEAVDKYMPNHLYMGARFADWGMTPEIRTGAANHVDVMSYNYYREGLNGAFWNFLDEIDMPSIIGEFHMGALDSGMFNPGLIGSHTQEIRGRMYTDYMQSVINNPYFVGAHWFQYIDSPLVGRAYDGENYNVGFVSVADVPYQPFVKAVKAVNTSLYTERFGTK